MDLLEFKHRLKKQGVTYERFLERVSLAGNSSTWDVFGSFRYVISYAFDWMLTKEGVTFWDNVAEEKRIKITVNRKGVFNGTERI